MCRGRTLRTSHTLKIKVKHVEAEDAKNRNCQTARGSRRLMTLVSFTESLLHTLLPKAFFSSQFVVERAYRIPPARGPQGAPTRTLIFKLLNSRDRDLVLQEARHVGELKFETTKLLYFLTILLKLIDCGNLLTISEPSSIQKAPSTVYFSLQDSGFKMASHPRRRLLGWTLFAWDDGGCCLPLSWNTVGPTCSK